ncbi:MAG: hypothetical protein QXR84_03815 [Candidatus Bathyarchaeia archaeon]|nr:hypothetical protein [Candidatus Bathyarchaeota archaeon]
MMNSLPKEEIQMWLTSLNKDPIFKILLKNSNLTKVQAETFLIDILAEKIVNKKLVYEEKAKLRLLKAGVSRGSFNRTLAQARKNIIKSIYTVILLGYLGIFDDPRLEPYIEIANKIRAYNEKYREILESGKIEEDQIKILQTLQNEIEKMLFHLSKPRSFSGKK